MHRKVNLASKQQKSKAHQTSRRSKPQPQPSSALKLAGRGLSRSEDILSLQRNIGNKAVGRMIAGRSNAAVQRTVTYIKFQNQKDATPEFLLPKFQAQHAEEYQLGQVESLPGQKLMDDDALKAFFKTLIKDPDKNYSITEALQLAAKEVKRRHAQRDFAPTSDYQGVKAQVLGADATLPVPVKIEEKADTVGVHPAGDIYFKPQVSVEVPGNEAGNWEIGLTQTVTASERNIRLVSAKGYRTIRLKMPGPHNDRRENTDPPYYDNLRARARLNAGFNRFDDLYLDDKPGWSADKSADERLQSATGTDSFKTWLLLRHRSGDPNIFLYEWTWSVNYVKNGQASLLAGGAGPNGEAAVLGGARANGSHTITDQSVKWPKLPLPTDFEFMKKKATKFLTIRSGQLSKSAYGELWNQYDQAIHDGDVQKALKIVNDLKSALKSMDEQGKKYWKDEALKASHFTPIYDSVKEIADQLGELV